MKIEGHPKSATPPFVPGSQPLSGAGEIRESPHPAQAIGELSRYSLPAGIVKSPFSSFKEGDLKTIHERSLILARNFGHELENSPLRDKVNAMHEHRFFLQGKMDEFVRANHGNKRDPYGMAAFASWKKGNKTNLR